MLASRPPVEVEFGHDVELPLQNVERVDGGFVFVGKEREHIDISLPAAFWALLIRVGIPCAGPRRSENDFGETILMPTLDEGR